MSQAWWSYKKDNRVPAHQGHIKFLTWIPWDYNISFSISLTTSSLSIPFWPTLQLKTYPRFKLRISVFLCNTSFKKLLLHNNLYLDNILANIFLETLTVLEYVVMQKLLKPSWCVQDHAWLKLEVQMTLDY